MTISDQSLRMISLENIISGDIFQMIFDTNGFLEEIQFFTQNHDTICTPSGFCSYKFAEKNKYDTINNYPKPHAVHALYYPVATPRLYNILTQKQKKKYCFCPTFW